MSTPTIKKAYEAIINALKAAMEANIEATIESVIDEIVTLASAKSGAGGGKATQFHRNEEGIVVAIKCYYHKLWMDPEVVEFGKKATSATGLNNMCKEGVSKWTAQQRAAKLAGAELLDQVVAGTLLAEDIPAAQKRIADECAVIVPREDSYGFETLEECLEDSANRPKTGDVDSDEEE